MIVRQGRMNNCAHVWQCFERVSLKLLLLAEDTSSCQKTG